MFPVWEPAVNCTDGPQPGVMSFARWVQERYSDEGYYNLGIYNCRTVRGGATTSMHGEGRALDAGFPVGDADGGRLLRRILSRPGRLGVQCVIYERRIYSAKSPEGRDYLGVVPHLDHLHIEFTWEAARELTYTTVKQVMEGRNKPFHYAGSRDLYVGHKGMDVRWLQKRVSAYPDGVFGPKTKEAVKAYERTQRHRYPRLLVDGVVGKLTWRTFGIKPTY